MQNNKKSITQEKKRHTRKHVTGSTRKKWIILLSKAKAGKVHDKKQLDEEDWVSNIPDAVVIEGDLGYQGLQNEFVNIRLLHTKHFFCFPTGLMLFCLTAKLTRRH